MCHPTMKHLFANASVANYFPTCIYVPFQQFSFVRSTARISTQDLKAVLPFCTLLLILIAAYQKGWFIYVMYSRYGHTAF